MTRSSAYTILVGIGDELHFIRGSATGLRFSPNSGVAAVKLAPGIYEVA